MPLALLFPDTNFLAHTSRLIEIGKALRGTYDWRVVFVGGPPYLRLAADEGFETADGFTVDRSITLPLAERAGLVDPFWWQRVVDLSIQSDLSAIRRHAPDVVVGDMHWSLSAAARLCSVPYVSVVNATWTRYFDHKLEAFDGHLLTRLLGRSSATRLLPAFKQVALWWWAMPYRARKNRMPRRPRVKTLLDVIEGDLTLLADVPEFCPTANTPASVRYVGPILWEPPHPPPTWLDRLDPERQTVYLSLGSTGGSHLAETARTVLDDPRFQVIMTTGRQVDAASLPASWHVTDYAPGALLMSRAHVSLNHGGNGTIYQALAAGIPVVGVPSHVDQQVQMQLCERAGVGVGVPVRGLTPVALREALHRVLEEPLYRENAQRLEAVLARTGGGADRSARLILSLTGVN
jgi:UDP:flavonoid glycosyltransferase YjiC (YdhE family)